MVFTVVEAEPSLYVKFQGPIPVNAMLTSVLEPLQIVAVPPITLVGREFTTIVALLVISAAWALQYKSFNAVMV